MPTFDVLGACAGGTSSSPDLATGISFRFSLDGDELHMTRRHGTTPADALRVFFEADDPVYDIRHRRYEQVAPDGMLLSWYWLEEGRRVHVITCKRPEPKEE